MTSKQADAILNSIVRKAARIPALRRRNPAPWTVTLRMNTRDAMARLNRKYRGKSGPTDVLSFDAPPVFRERGILGELVVCRPVMNAQARACGHSALAELKILLTHGLLDLLGFDHERGPRAAKEMARWERRLLGNNAPARGLISRGESASMERSKKRRPS